MKAADVIWLYLILLTRPAAFWATRRPPFGRRVAMRVEAFLVEHRNVQMHFTPTYSSLLKQVENWFSRIQRDVIGRGIFTSVKDLGQQPRRCFREHNPKP